MRTTILGLLLFCITGFSGNTSTLSFNHVYAPNGFDSNDNLEIFVEAVPPTLCSKILPAMISVEEGTIHIGLSYEELRPNCSGPAIPVLETIKLPELTAGAYNIIVNNDVSKATNLVVAPHKPQSAIDDHIYPMVYDIEKFSADNSILLKAYNPSDCYQFEGYEVMSNGKDSFSVLPKLQQVRDLCPMKLTEFEVEIKLPETLSRKKVLLHIRSIHGKSFNRLFTRK